MDTEALLDAVSKKKACHLTTVVDESPADLVTPVSAFLKLRDFGAKFLLESVGSGTVLGRYSFIGIRPEIRIILGKEDLVLQDSDARLSLPYSKSQSALSMLKEVLSRFRIEMPASHPRLLGGAVGYISYDFVRFFERIPDLSSDPLNFPVALFYLTDTLLVFDHLRRKLQIMCLAPDSSEGEARRKSSEIMDLLSSQPRIPSGDGIESVGDGLSSNFTRERFCETVLKVKEHISHSATYTALIAYTFDLPLCDNIEYALRNIFTAMVL